jgi:hypothetical protein
MIKFYRMAVILFLLMILGGSCEKLSEILSKGDWRSDLYPKDWHPGFTDQEGRFLHDFSYAGYHAGNREIPNIQNNIVDITGSPYYADNTGKEDVTEIIQRAVNDIGVMGGGVVYLPAGIYVVSARDDNSVIRISFSNVVLRGESAVSTMIVNTSTNMRGKSIILIEGQNRMRWNENITNTIRIQNDLLYPTYKIPVESTTGFNINDYVVITSDVTDYFIIEHGMEGQWHNEISGPVFYRKIVHIDNEKNILQIDAPTRYWLKVRDNSRVYKVNDPLEEVGIENLSFGNYQSLNDGFGLNDFRAAGTGAYDSHLSHVIRISGCINSWVSRVSTFRPALNEEDFHILSNGILIEHSGNITIENM